MEEKILREDKIKVSDLVYLEDFAATAYQILNGNYLQNRTRQEEKLQYLFEMYAKVKNK